MAFYDVFWHLSSNIKACTLLYKVNTHVKALKVPVVTNRTVKAAINGNALHKLPSEVHPE